MAALLESVRVIDPRVDINSLRNRMYGILDSGIDQTWQQFISQNYNNSSISWETQPPSKETYINRKLYIQMSFLLTFTGQSAGAGINLLQAAGLPAAPGVSPGLFNYDAPRCCGLSQACTNMMAKMGNSQVSSNLQAYSRFFQRFARSYDEENTDMSGTAAMSDKSQSYNDLLGFPLNPLGAYGDNTTQIPRGGFQGALIIRNDSTGAPGDIAVVQLTLIEPFYLSPWAWGRYQEEVAFIQLQNINVNLTLGGRGNNGNLAGLSASLWSHAPAGSALTSVVTNVTGGTLFMNFISPSITTSLPRSVVYSYFEPLYLPTGSNIPIAPGASTTLVLNNVQLQSTPQRIYSCVTEQDQDNDITKTDTYFRINSIQVTYGNRSGLFSNTTSYDLYQMYLRNGGNMSYQQWNNFVGGLICISMGTDLPLSPLNAPGKVENQNFTYTLNVTNISNRPITPTLHTVIIFEGTMTITDGNTQFSTGVLNEQDVVNSKSQQPVALKPAKTVWGSGFFDDVGNFFKRLVRPAITAAQALVPAQYQPLVQGADTVAKSFGLGGVRKGYGGALIGGDELKTM